MDYATEDRIEVSTEELNTWALKVGDGYFSYLKENNRVPNNSLCFDIVNDYSRDSKIFKYVVPVGVFRGKVDNSD